MTTHQTRVRPWFSPLAWALVAIIGVLAAPHPTPAQAQSAAANPGAIELAQEPMVAPSLGMTIHLPVGSKYKTAYNAQTSGAGTSFTLFAPDDTWMMTLHNPTSEDHTLTVQDIAQSIISDLQATRVIRDSRTGKVTQSGIRVLDIQENLTVNNQPASRFYLSFPSNSDTGGLINGYTVFQIGPGRFVLLQLDCAESVYERARAQYETVVATSTFRDPLEMASERALTIKTGERFLSSLNREIIEAALPAERIFHRVFRPAQTGASSDAEEIAYTMAEARMGSRGDLDPRKPMTRWTQADHEQGFIVYKLSRILQPGGFVDVEAISFLSFDRTNETWTVRMQIHQRGDTAQWTETGVRSGDEIKVTIDKPGSTPETTSWSTPEAYLSQVEKQLLPTLLAGFAAPTTFGFYHYHSATGALALRRDILETSEQTSSGSALAWKLRSRSTENALEDLSLVAADGRLLRREQQDGVIIEPITLEALRSLWRTKDLPMK